MSNERIRQTLIDVEQNLSQLDSARTQVLSITEESHKLSQGVHELVKNFENLNTNIFTEKDSTIESIAKYNDSFRERADKITDNIDSSLNSFVTKMNASASDFSDNLEMISQKHISSSEKIILEKGAIMDGLLEKHQNLSEALEKIEDQLKVLDLPQKMDELMNAMNSNKELLISIGNDFIETNTKLAHFETSTINLFTEETDLINSRFESLQALILKYQNKQFKSFVVIVVLIIILMSSIIFSNFN